MLFAKGTAVSNHVYVTKVPRIGTTLQIVRRMAEIAWEHSLHRHGDLKQGETRIFWMSNELSEEQEERDLPYSQYDLVQVTAIRERNAVHIVAELGQSSVSFYNALISVEITSTHL